MRLSIDYFLLADRKELLLQAGRIGYTQGKNPGSAVIGDGLTQDRKADPPTGALPQIPPGGRVRSLPVY